MNPMRACFLPLLVLMAAQSACADFPESRYRVDAATVADAADGSPFDAAIADGPGADQADDTTPPPDGPRPDGPALDSPPPRPDLILADTGPLVDLSSCTPNAFVACRGSKLEKCNGSGKGTVLVDCAPGNCVGQRCDLCTPGSSRCAGASAVQTCTSDGVWQARPCPLGCQSQACCADSDKDGQTNCQGDCDDRDADVYRGQQTYFTKPSKSKGFDYNCDGKADPEEPDPANCQGSGANCGGDGWVGSVPACGVTGTWGTCWHDKGSCDVGSTRKDVQACR